VSQVVQALQQAQGLTLPAPASMSLAQVATAEILGQTHFQRPLGTAGLALSNAWSTTPTGTRRLSIVAGNGQIGAQSAAVPLAPAVRVTDGFGRPVAGIAVTFAPDPGSGAVTGSPATTGQDGTAVLGSWTLGSAAGQQTLTARGAGATVAFKAVAV
jgi:hypothetical protein